VGEDLKRYTTWDFGDFKPTSTEQRAGQTITVFNALVDEGDAIAVQSFDTQDAAQAAHRLGLRRMFMLALKEQVKYLEKNLPGLQAMTMQWLPFGSPQDLQRQILAVTFDRCSLNEPWPETEKEFAARCKDAKARLNLVAQESRRVGRTSRHAKIPARVQSAFPGDAGHSQPVRMVAGQGMGGAYAV
jgi:ATP-dependent helicase HrpA